ASAADLWTLIANVPAVKVFRLTGTMVSDCPFVMLVSGYMGVGSRLAQVPLWMWAGCVTAGAFDRVTTTCVWPFPISVSVAVPLSPEPFCSFNWIVVGIG